MIYPKNPKRKSISKRDRETVFNKTNGRCAYCGENLDPKCFHVDHMIPIRSNQGTNDIDNLWAACRRCNSFKGGNPLEIFRSELEQQADRAERYSINHRMALAYGLIQRTEKTKITFYFERIGLDGLNPTRNNLQN